MLEEMTCQSCFFFRFRQFSPQCLRSLHSKKNGKMNKYLTKMQAMDSIKKTKLKPVTHTFFISIRMRKKITEIHDLIQPNPIRDFCPFLAYRWRKCDKIQFTFWNNFAKNHHNVQYYIMPRFLVAKNVAQTVICTFPSVCWRWWMDILIEKDTMINFKFQFEFVVPGIIQF